MKKELLLTSYLLAHSLLSFGQSVLMEGVDPKWKLEGTIQADNRVTHLPDSDTTRSQGRVRIGFTIDAGGIVEIVGIAATGTTFNSTWETYYNTNGTTDDAKIVFRNLYLRKVFGKYTVEAGALTPEPTVGDAGNAPVGWMDGIRIIAQTKVGKFKVVAGSLGSFKQPDMFKRDFQGNFLEIEMERKVFDNLISRTAIEHYNQNTYAREQLQLDVTVLGDKVIKLFANALLSVNSGKATWEVGAEFDVLKTILGKFEKRLEMKVYYSDINENLPGRSDTISSFHTFGPRTTVALGGNVTKDGRLSWSTRASYGKTTRYDVVLTYKIPFKVKR